MVTLKLNDKDYTLPSVDSRLFGDFLQFATPHIPRPLDLLKDKIAGYPPHLQEIMVKEALRDERRPLGMDSPEIQGFLGTTRGYGEFLRLLWTRHQPDLKESAIWDLDAIATLNYGEGYHLTDEEFEKVFKRKRT